MTVQEVNLMRRSIQHFDSERPLDMELVKRIIEEATYAPSGYNLQPWRVIVVQSDENRDLLFNQAYKQEKIKDAPVTLIIIADKEGYKKENKAWDELIEEYGEDRVSKVIESASKAYGKDEIAKTKFAHLNTSLFSMTLMLLFKAYGIDTHAIGGMKQDEIKKSFNIKANEDINMLLPIGYRNEDKPLNKRKNRKTYEDIVTVF